MEIKWAKNVGNLFVQQMATKSTWCESYVSYLIKI